MKPSNATNNMIEFTFSYALYDTNSPQVPLEFVENIGKIF
jgi:hypothetical protein